MKASDKVDRDALDRRMTARQEGVLHKSASHGRCHKASAAARPGPDSAARAAISLGGERGAKGDRTYISIGQG